MVSIRKGLFFLVFLLIGGSLLTSCEKAYIQFGTQYVDNGYANIVLVDTFSTALSTVYRDSVITSGTGTALAGAYTDASLGPIQVKSYFEIKPPAFFDLSNFTAFDSLILVIKPNKYYFGDTTAIQHLNVYQLAQSMQFAENGSSFYNTTSFPVNATPLGSLNQPIYPNAMDSLVIRLDDNTGQQLFDMFKAKDNNLSTADFFTAYFHGLQFAPAPGMNAMSAVFGFQDSIKMRVMYHESGVTLQQKSLDFALVNQNKQFNQVITDRTSTPLSLITPGIGEIPSEKTGGQVFMQYLTGCLIKVKFPTLRTLLQYPDYYGIQKAELDIYPVPGTYKNQQSLPANLGAYTTTAANLTGSALTDVNATGATVPQSGNLFTDPVYGENTHYTYNVTSYLKNEITQPSINKDGLLLYTGSADFNTSLNKLVIATNGTPGGKVQLKIYYASIKP